MDSMDVVAGLDSRPVLTKPTPTELALAGVVEHKRAAKGVLITTSWFGRASHTFAAARGRLQLIEGRNYF
ncbi:restriction endonuclease [Streptomyces sp. NPDC060334]|uniref:restriction endonuclease n=1 Tax=Streptomyces sp. NPDC060334 TaxID=3347099 RepID=UPI003656D521